MSRRYDSPGGRRALEILLGEQNLRDAVDYFIEQRPGCFTAEMVLTILRSKVAMERCYEMYESEPGSEASSGAVFLLSKIATYEALPWVREFLADTHEVARWNGLQVLSTILYGPLNDADVATAKELVEMAESFSA